MAQPQDHDEEISSPLASVVPSIRDFEMKARVEVLEERRLPRESPDSDPFLFLSRRLDRTDYDLFLKSDPFLRLSCRLDRTDRDSFLNSSHVISDPFIKALARYGYNFALGLHPPHDESGPPSPDFTEDLFPANACSIKGQAGEALPNGSASFKRIFSFFDLGTDSGFGPRRPQDDIWGIRAVDDIWGISALPGDVGVDLELGYPLDGIGGIRAHNAYYNQELLFYKQWKAYIKDLKIVNSGVSDSMLIQTVIALLGEAFGGALAHALSSSSEPSKVKSVVQASILIGIGLTVAGIGLRRFKRRLSDNVMKGGAMGTALAIIVAFAVLLPPWLAWSVGATTSILVATGLAMI